MICTIRIHSIKNTARPTHNQTTFTHELVIAISIIVDIANGCLGYFDNVTEMNTKQPDDLYASQCICSPTIMLLMYSISYRDGTVLQYDASM